VLAVRASAGTGIISRVGSETGRGASDAEIRAVEARLGLADGFPSDFREWLGITDGAEGWFGDYYVMLYPRDGIVAATEAADADERLPGFVAIGSDGSREILAYDFHKSAPPIVMVDIVCEGWPEALFQAASFAEFMAQRDAGEPLKWEEGGP
jgi:hypothetical protein